MEHVRSVTPPSSIEESVLQETKATVTKPNINSSDSSLFAPPRSKSTHPKRNNGSDKSQSWRSTGWTPLAYPSAALYAAPSSSSSSCDTNIATVAAAITNSQRITMGHEQPPYQKNVMRLNPYFPLHKDVILAATRELLILDGSIDSKTLEVTSTKQDFKEEVEHEQNSVKTMTNNDPSNNTMHTHMSQKKQEIVRQNVRKKISSKVACRKNYVGKRKRNSSNLLPTKSDETEETVKHMSFIERFRQRFASLEDVEPVQKKAKSTTAHTNIVKEDDNSLKSKLLQELLFDENNQKDQKSTLDRDKLSSEDIANFILRQCVWDADGLSNKLLGPDCDEKDENDHNVYSNVPSFIRLSNDNDDNATKAVTTQILKNNAINDSIDIKNSITLVQPRPRKVSDVDDLTFASSIPLSSEISPHIAAIACNIDTKCQNILDSVKTLVGDDFSRQQAIILEQKNALPELLNISIMAEAHLRRITYHITECLISHFHPKALREFLGYKSSLLKNDRIMHLMADYLFDVSHAMFAWDHTEAETFGSELLSMNKPNSSLDDKSSMIRDKKVCDSLFDNRALRKIGGFDSSSLLYQAISIKRIRNKGDTWTTLAKSSLGKKILRHHWDDNARVQVGQLRRGQRIRKIRSIYYPVIGTDRGSNVELGSKGLAIKSRSRSSSFASVESESTIENSVQPVEHYGQVQSSMPDSLSISITRDDTSKSWGVLLAKEGSMCVVMRVSQTEERGVNLEACQNSKLQKGDLIASIRNERNEIVNTPGHSHINTTVSSDWFSEVVCLFKSSCTLHLNVTRVLRPQS